MLDNQNKELISNQLIYMNEQKKVSSAYLLLIFLGTLGCHRFYACLPGKKIIGLLQCACTIAGWVLIFIGLWHIGIFLLLFTNTTWIIDLFLLPSIVRKTNLVIMNRILNKL